MGFAPPILKMCITVGRKNKQNIARTSQEQGLIDLVVCVSRGATYC
jgi:hypothetical protein